MHRQQPEHRTTCEPSEFEPLENGSSGKFANSKDSLRKHAYSNILKITTPITESFQIKIDIFHISAQNINCGIR